MTDISRLTLLTRILSNGLSLDNLPLSFAPVQTNWIAITGAPGSGKTSICQHLETYGFNVIPEMSRIVIESGLENGFSIHEIMQNPELLTTSVLARNFDRAKNLSPQNPLVWDTGVLDSAAFYEVAGVEYHNKKNLLIAFRYKAAVFLELLPQNALTSDKARPQDILLRSQIDLALRATYSQFGYSISMVPVMNIESRAKHVQNIINAIF